MSIQIHDTIQNPAEFNKKAQHPLQSYEWGEARKATGVDILRLEDTENVYTMTIHPIPYTPYKIGYVPRSVFSSTELLEFLRDWGKKNNLIFIKFEPYVEKNPKSEIRNKLETQNQTQTQISIQIQNPTQNLKPKSEIQNPLLLNTRYLIPSRHPLFPNWSQVLDLTKTEDELLKNLKQKTRYNVRLAEKKGVVVKEESTDEGFEKFLKLYFETTKRQQYFGHNEDYHRIIWNNLKGSIAKILIAYYEDEPLAAYELFHFKDRFYYPYGGSSEKHRNLMAANLLMWEAIKLGKNLGAKTFDMWGSLPPNYDQNGSWSGFTRFKEGYGTEFVEFVGSYDLVINSLMYKGYNITNNLRTILLKLTSRI